MSTDEVLVRKVVVCDPEGNSTTIHERKTVTVDWHGDKPVNSGSYLMFGEWTISIGEQL